jgi:hypothetical protein
MASRTKKQELPRFKLRAVFIASFPHPYRDGTWDETTLRYIITVSGEHDEDLRENAYYSAKLKMEMLGLKPLGVELEDRAYFMTKSLLARHGVGHEDVPAVLWADSPEDKAKAVAARIYVPENKAEALELYDDATKHPTMIRSARSMLRKPGEPKAGLLVETMAGAQFRFPSDLGTMRPKAGSDVAPWLPVLIPLNDLATALKAQAPGFATDAGRFPAL